MPRLDGVTFVEANTCLTTNVNPKIAINVTSAAFDTHLFIKVR